uniref:Uncharacterized protein n=1 Tax=Aegilops tauschii subsp. strangulata TaxID=200361 RepID=A0A453TBY2_AEGTS
MYMDATWFQQYQDQAERPLRRTATSGNKSIICRSTKQGSVQNRVFRLTTDGRSKWYSLLDFLLCDSQFQN